MTINGAGRRGFGSTFSIPTGKTLTLHKLEFHVANSHFRLKHMRGRTWDKIEYYWLPLLY